jgi:predicted DNA-binding transcriptional regulator AlpA
MSQPILISQLGYRKPEAAKFVGLSPSKFMLLVKQERMPRPSKIDGCCVWDVRELIAAFDDLSGKSDGNWTI